MCCWQTHELIHQYINKTTKSVIQYSKHYNSLYNDYACVTNQLQSRFKTFTWSFLTSTFINCFFFLWWHYFKLQNMIVLLWNKPPPPKSYLLFCSVIFISFFSLSIVLPLSVFLFSLSPSLSCKSVYINLLCYINKLTIQLKLKTY